MGIGAGTLYRLLQNGSKTRDIDFLPPTVPAPGTGTKVGANPVNQAVGREILVAATYRQSSYANPSQFDYDDAAQLDRFFDGSEIGEE
jgi:hypothetical protein